MCSEKLPKEFEKTTEVLPFSKYGLSSMSEFQKAESELQQLEKLKRAGLSDAEIKLYEQNEAGTIDQKKMESTVLKNKLDVIYDKIRKVEEESEHVKTEPSTSDNILKPVEKPLNYPEGHPMNSIKEIESNLFSHLNTDDIPPLTKRRKALRRFERKKERILSQDHSVPYHRKESKWDMRQDQYARNKCMQESYKTDTHISQKTGSKWDMQETPNNTNVNITKIQSETEREKQPRPIPQNRHPVYTIKDNKIVKMDSQDNLDRVETQDKLDRVDPQENLERVDQQDNLERVDPQDNSERVDPQENVQNRLIHQNDEENLLEGTKIAVDDIKKINEHKNYQPGIPSKVLILRNISPTVNKEQLKLLFNQFILGNGGPVDVQLFQGTAFVYFANEETAIQALEETNGTVVAGRPIVAYFSTTSRHR